MLVLHRYAQKRRKLNGHTWDLAQHTPLFLRKAVYKL